MSDHNETRGTMSDQHTNETRELDLDAIEARLGTARRSPESVRVPVALYAADVSALVAEVRRLREAFAESVEERARLEDIIAEQA